MLNFRNSICSWCVYIIPSCVHTAKREQTHLMHSSVSLFQLVGYFLLFRRRRKQQQQHEKVRERNALLILVVRVSFCRSQQNIKIYHNSISSRVAHDTQSGKIILQIDEPIAAATTTTTNKDGTKWNKVIIWFDPMNIIFNFFFIRLYPFFDFVFIVKIHGILSLIVRSFFFSSFLLQMDALCAWIAAERYFMCLSFSPLPKWHEKEEEKARASNRYVKVLLFRSIVWMWCCIVIYTRDMRCVHGVWQFICANSNRTHTHTHSHPG